MTPEKTKRMEELAEEFLNDAQSKIDRCDECGYHSVARLEDAVKFGYTAAMADAEKEIAELESLSDRQSAQYHLMRQKHDALADIKSALSVQVLEQQIAMDKLQTQLTTEREASAKLVEALEDVLTSVAIKEAPEYKYSEAVARAFELLSQWRKRGAE